MDLYRVVYTSRPFGYDSAMLNGILMDARRANERDEITGALICRDDIYLQWLEGPEEAVRQATDRIRRDDRHLDMRLHVEEGVAERVFGQWSMLHDPAASWIWSRAEVEADAAGHATPAEVEGFFLKLRDTHASPDPT